MKPEDFKPEDSGELAQTQPSPPPPGDPRLAECLARYIERRLQTGEACPAAQLCPDDPGLQAALAENIAEYERLEALLAPPPDPAPVPVDGRREALPEPLPEFPGFRTIERLGQGGGGSVYKLEDRQLGRIVAAKVLRPDSPLGDKLEDFLREARSLALFDDPHIVRIFEFHREADPPYLIMEYVDGFPLNQTGLSLEFQHRARIMTEIAAAVERAHQLGIQHRDLKPANILLDGSLRPKILDFGLSRRGPFEGHGRGTLPYMAPEQLDPARPLDDRTDVYALGVILYELLAGVPPYRGGSVQEVVEAIRRGEPELPVETQPDVPEPLQAIALKAMEREPQRRYGSARELAQDLHRYLAGEPVLARPSLYLTALGRRILPHLESIREWLRLKLIYPHEAEGLLEAYGRLESREDDWIVHSRVLSLSQIALYLGAFLLVCGSLLFFEAYLRDAVSGIWRPVLIHGLPIIGMDAVAAMLFRRDRQPVAVAVYLAGALLLPLFLLIFFREAGLWPAAADNARELFGAGSVSNRQLQVASLVGCAWAAWLALHTRTIALSAVFAGLLGLFHLGVLTDWGLRTWLEQGAWDRLALHLFPLAAVFLGLGFLNERRARPWLARVLYFGGVGLAVLSIELLALNGKTFQYLGISLAPYQPASVSDPLLLDTLVAMTLNGLLIYTGGWGLDRWGTPLLAKAAGLLFAISPFTILEPLCYLVKVGEYSRRFDWLLLFLALAICLASRFRQRRSFYYAGMINTGLALYLITDHHRWFDRPAWAMTVVGVGLLVLAVGYRLDSRERSRRTST